MNRTLYPPEVLVQASIEVANDPNLGNSDLARRVEEVIAVGEDPFEFIFHAIKSGKEMMERAEKIRTQHIGANGNQAKNTTS